MIQNFRLCWRLVITMSIIYCKLAYQRANRNGLCNTNYLVEFIGSHSLLMEPGNRLLLLYDVHMRYENQNVMV